MKKVVNCNLFLLLLISLLVIGTKHSSNAKIIYEGNQITSKTTSAVAGKISTSNDVIVQVFLDYEAPDFSYVMGQVETNDAESVKQGLLKEGIVYHKSRNQEAMENIDMPYTQQKYMSQLAPYIEYQYDGQSVANNLARISNLADNNYVSQIVIKDVEKEEFQESSVYSQGVVNAIDTINSKTLTGNGVKVGLLETGILDEKAAALANTKFVIRNDFWGIETVEDHATQMATIIAGNKGYAPNCTIYNAQIHGSFNQEVDWLIEQGCDVINMSFGEKEASGVYKSDSAYIDYVVRLYRKIVVVAAGNNGGLVCNPGLSYNALTVGTKAQTANGTWLDSSYITNTGISKPNLIAPGEGIFIEGFRGVYDGTSISASITTGCIALLLEKYAYYKYNPEMLYAMIQASSTPIDGAFSGFDYYSGAGLLNFQKILDDESNSFYYENSRKTPGVILSRTVNLVAGQTIRMSLMWMNYSTNNTNGLTITDYDIRLRDSNDNMVASTGSTQNKELLAYTCTQTGPYSFQIYQYVDLMCPTTEVIGGSYSIV